ncbi:4Fe-4S dicluster domain-containing protein [candidate division KSB3 bacterium]|uniref:4Fe-4S dicluster domain-containing protein n=1 Tax=candidate division KSB3 bacterium TaxID=2044937 RepID=A0A9D5JUX8_9BACT|nr:4Fe-4S dicluster domain-containing protein [candidate division KSB3 bacterium]MBD3324610.1 4Fe-4S dicluster domain-containing protein [candidate division KSB3 bacterium]
MSAHDRQAVICAEFGIPEFLAPWLDRFFEPHERDLILTLAHTPVSADSRGQLFASDAAVERAYKRGIITYRADGGVELADFHARFEIWALFEGWKDVPPEIRTRLNTWELEAYEAQKQELFTTLKAGGPQEFPDERTEYVLLHEAQRILEDAEHIYLWPCNCRAMMQACSQPLDNCLRFTNDRGLGWEISVERAKEIMGEAHRNGLMHVAEVSRSAEGTLTGGICNCCPDCCYPHQVAERQGTQTLWPTSRYIVRYFPAQCRGCGRCVRRCPFQAFEFTETAEGLTTKPQKTLLFHPDRCRGCGLCVSSCPDNAIRMQPRSTAQRTESGVWGVTQTEKAG